MSAVQSEIFKAGTYGPKFDYAKNFFEFCSSGAALEFHD